MLSNVCVTATCLHSLLETTKNDRKTLEVIWQNILKSQNPALYSHVNISSKKEFRWEIYVKTLVLKYLIIDYVAIKLINYSLQKYS